MLKSQGPRLILASNSTARRAMLRQAGLEITVHPSDVDEGGAKAALQAGNATGAAIAAALAQAKARAVARDHPDAWVIGADQILSCDGELFDKAPKFRGGNNNIAVLEGPPARVACGCLRGAGRGRGDVAPWQHTSTAYEKMPIHQALAGDENRCNASQITNQLNLFDF